MGKRIVADPAKMDAAAKKLAELSETYSQIAKAMLSDATTMGDAWQGEDNIAFTNQLKGFTEELEAMAKKLMLGSGALSRQSENYKTRQNDIVSAAHQLPN